MNRRKVATTVYITRSQDQALKLLAERTGVPAAQYIREGIDLVLKKHRDEIPAQLSLIGDDDQDDD
jgi:predicted DNA-binding protein